MHIIHSVIQTDTIGSGRKTYHHNPSVTMEGTCFFPPFSAGQTPWWNQTSGAFGMVLDGIKASPVVCPLVPGSEGFLLGCGWGSGSKRIKTMGISYDLNTINLVDVLSLSDMLIQVNYQKRCFFGFWAGCSNIHWFAGRPTREVCAAASNGWEIMPSMAENVQLR